MILGDTGVSLLENLPALPVKIELLAYFTGIPVDCISIRVPFLEQMGFVEVTDGCIRITKEGARTVELLLGE